ncbi:MAG: ParB/RepB/Spo0J family partition protein [Firmicutes bacterium]|nr:ParB/RepB/Spo0J family partition protein [Bacillota bacterium]
MRMAATDWLTQIPVDDIRPNPYQPRAALDEAGLQELAASIREHGVVQPIVVRPRDDGYELIAGERRWRAAQRAGLREIPAVVREASDREAAVLALLENLQREDLHFLEVAEGYARLLREFDLTQEQLAAQVGRSQSAVANLVRLLRLPAEVREVISREMLSERHARALLAVADPEEQLRLARAAARHGWTVRELEAEVAKLAAAAAPAQRRTAVVSDARIFLNEFRRAVRTLQAQGFRVEMTESVEEERIHLDITIHREPGVVWAGGRPRRARRAR